MRCRRRYVRLRAKRNENDASLYRTLLLLLLLRYTRASQLLHIFVCVCVGVCELVFVGVLRVVQRVEHGSVFEYYLFSTRPRCVPHYHSFLGPHHHHFHHGHRRTLLGYLRLLRRARASSLIVHSSRHRNSLRKRVSLAVLQPSSRIEPGLRKRRLVPVGAARWPVPRRRRLCCRRLRVPSLLPDGFSGGAKGVYGLAANASACLNPTDCLLRVP